MSGQAAKLEPESVPCGHELLLINRTTFHVSCADCKELLAEPVAAKHPTPILKPVAPPAAAESCPHLMVTTNPSTNMTSCLVCKATLTKETYMDWKGDVHGLADDEANMKALPSHLFDTRFRAEQTNDVAAYRIEEAYRGETNRVWDPRSGEACPHFLKTTNVKTGKVTCSMCNQPVDTA